MNMMMMMMMRRSTIQAYYNHVLKRSVTHFANLPSLRDALKQGYMEQIKEQGKEDAIKKVEIGEITFRLKGDPHGKQYPLSSDTDFQRLKTEHNNGRFAALEYDSHIYFHENVMDMSQQRKAVEEVAVAVRVASCTEQLGFN